MGQRGTTLVEVLCVLVLISIAAGIASTTGTAALDNYRLQAAADRLVSDLREAREKAITENLWQGIKFFPAANMYRMTRNGIRLSDVRLEQGIQLNSNQLDLSFYPTGSPSGGGTITLSNKRGKQIQIVVAPVTGRVRLTP